MLAQRTLLVAALLAGPALAAPLPEPKAVTGDDAKWLMPDADYFLKVNLKQALGADVMTAGGAAAMKDIFNNNAQFKSVLDSTGVDLTKDLDSLLVTGLGISAKDAKYLAVFRGSFKQDKIHEALKKQAEKDDKLKLVKEGGVQLYEMSQGDNSSYAAFADGSTLVVTHSKDATVDAAKNGGKKAAAISAGMRAAMAKLSGKESFALALVVNSDLQKMLGGLPNVGAAASKVKTLTAGVTLTDAIALNVAGATGEARSATQLANLLKGFKEAGALAVAGMEELPPVAGDVLNAIKISASKEAVLVDLKMTKEMIDSARKAGEKKN